MEDDYDYSNGDPAVEFDADYEFDADRFFDFTRHETSDEASQAEFGRKLSAFALTLGENMLIIEICVQCLLVKCGVNPGSGPGFGLCSSQLIMVISFSVGLLSREQSENASCSTSSKALHNAPESSSMAFGNTDGEVANEGVSLNLKNYSLQSFQNQQSASTVLKENIINASNKSKTKLTWKPSFPRTSTLMKPTASQLAKQNHEHLIENFRFQKSGNNSSVVEGQAAKRQKIEGGHLYKAAYTDQQANFVHKAPKREGNANENLGRGRLRLTVPRSPDLATAQRAQRIRKNDNSGTEHVSTLAPGFRARPLNRKVYFEAPSFLLQKRSTPKLPEFQEFHLKTSERATQNTAAGPSTSGCCDNNSKVRN
ncbi:uncharacterized protein LOC143636798 [Bidens hawaiensis]|uniref:uncharacterized protein LOC143636798 n=1 Tax=Bidens hawaiensis TaxID=980011 RepID=UPI004049C03E